MAIVQTTLSGVSVITAVGAPGVSVVGPTGPRGPIGQTGLQGVPGQDGGRTTRIAATLIPPRRMVVDLGSGLCGVADPTNPAQAGLVVGFVVDGAIAGTAATIIQGDLDGVAFDFGFGAAGPLYMADDATLTLSPRTNGVSQVVGWTPDGVQAVIRLGPAHAIVSLGGGAIVQPSTAAILEALFANAPDSPAGQPPGTFYRNGGGLERVLRDPDTTIPTAVIRQALAQIWDTLPKARDGVAAGRLWLNGRALERIAPATPTSTVIPPAFLAALGALWDGAPASPQGLGSREFYRNGTALERTP